MSAEVQGRSNEVCVGAGQRRWRRTTMAAQGQKGTHVLISPMYRRAHNKIEG
jgi:hypothetical protein